MRQGRENQGAAESFLARRAELDPIRASPYGPAANYMSHQEVGHTTAPDHGP